MAWNGLISFFFEGQYQGADISAVTSFARENWCSRYYHIKLFWQIILKNITKLTVFAKIDRPQGTTYTKFIA